MSDYYSVLLISYLAVNYQSYFGKNVFQTKHGLMKLLPVKISYVEDLFVSTLGKYVETEV